MEATTAASLFSTDATSKGLIPLFWVFKVIDLLCFALKEALKYQLPFNRCIFCSATPSSHLGPSLAEQHHESQVSRRRREAQRAHAVFRHHVHAGAKLQQQGGDLLVAQVTLDAQHRGVAQHLCAVIDVGPSEHQQATDLVEEGGEANRENDSDV